jgi:hypothetical protein
MITINTYCYITPYCSNWAETGDYSLGATWSPLSADPGMSNPDEILAAWDGEQALPYTGMPFVDGFTMIDA